MTDRKDSEVGAPPKTTKSRGVRAQGEATSTRRVEPAQVGAGKPAKAASAKPRSGTPKRQEQQRAIDTRQTILAAALSEFAEKGFDAASIRNIGARTGLQHPLITYHYRTKEVLWRAVAENAFAEIRRLWDEDVPDDERMSPIERLRAEYSAFLRFTITYPDFHHFMLRESRPGNPRLPWLVETMLKPAMQRLLPQIRGAQADGDLPQGDPSLFHYMMIGMMSVLSSLKDEIHQSTGLEADDPAVIDAYLALIDRLVFSPRAAAGPVPAGGGR